MVITYHTGAFSDNNQQDIKDFVLEQSPRFAESLEIEFNALLSKSHSCYAIAKDGDVIVGLRLQFSVEENPYLSAHTDLNSFLATVPTSLSSLVVPAHIYIKSGYSNQNIGDEVSRRAAQYSIDAGYSYQINYGYETQAIFDYAQRIGNLIDTGVEDYNNYRIYLRDLQDTVDYVTP
jgi:hypothetical protein